MHMNFQALVSFYINTELLSSSKKLNSAILKRNILTLPPISVKIGEMKKTKWRMPPSWNLVLHYFWLRPDKTNEYFEIKLGRRDNVGKIYKLTELGSDLLRNSASTWWWNVMVLWLSTPTFFLFFHFLGQPTGRNFGQICTLNVSKARVPSNTRYTFVPSNSLWGGLWSKKPPNFGP